MLSIEGFSAPVRTLAYLLPVTPAIRLVQDLMLRGVVVETFQYGVLAAIAIGTLLFSWLVLRRGMTRT